MYNVHLHIIMGYITNFPSFISTKGLELSVQDTVQTVICKSRTLSVEKLVSNIRFVFYFKLGVFIDTDSWLTLAQ